MSQQEISKGDIVIGKVHGVKKKFWVKVSGADLKIPIKRVAGDSEQLKNWRTEKAKVAVKILSAKNFYGEIIGAVKSTDIDNVIKSHGVIEEFPANVRAEAALIGDHLSVAEISKRIDRRHLQIVTIDGEDAKDLDDGVFAEKIDGGYFLGVYIADVSYYVRANSPLDREAFERGTSIYPVDRVVPMLPKELSNGICSLNAGVERLAMACEMYLDFSGKIISYKIFPTVIKVFQRLNYMQVNNFFNGAAGLQSCAKNLNTLLEVYKLRKKIRAERGAIDFEIPEIKIILDESGAPIKLTKKINGVAENLIEECMLAANETVAEHTLKNKIPSLYRVHELPTAEKINTFNQLLAHFNLHISKNEPRAFQKVLAQVKGTPAEKVISSFALRTMQQARYSPENLGHFGLAAEFYTHFTSPIRRYPDLIVHRMLRAKPGKIEKLARRLEEFAKQSSERERRAVEIEREAVDLKSAEYMQRFLGKNFDAVICSVASFGFFVELESGVDGLVRAASLKDDFYSYAESEFALIGVRTGKTFRLGDKVRVRLTEANVELRRMTFELIEGVVAEDLIVEV